MKIAICFSGAIRSFKYCYPSIYKYLIEPLNADIFLHAWSITEIDNTQEVKYKFSKDCCTNDYVIEKLCPKKYVIDEYNSSWEKKIIQEANMDGIDFMIVPDKYKKICKNDPHAYKKYAHNAMGMYYKIMKCNELKCEYEKEHGFEYDIVIRARLDFIWNKFVTIDDIKSSSLVFTINDSYCNKFKIPNNDRFFGSNSKIMNKFTNIFNDIKNNYEKNIPIQGSDLFVEKIKNYKSYIFGDKDYYFKFINNYHIVKSKESKIFITISSNLLYNIAIIFLQQGYQVFGYKSGFFLHFLTCYDNYNEILCCENNYSYYVIDDSFNETQNLNNVTLISCNKIKENINTILIKCKLVNETNQITTLKSNECYIPELSNFIYQFIINKCNKSIMIDGSCNLNLIKNDIIFYNIWAIDDKINSYLKYKITNRNELTCIDEKYNNFNSKIKVITNIIFKYIIIINILNYFNNHKIGSIYKIQKIK